MLIIRPIASSDLSAYTALAEEASLGITSLPKDRTKLQTRITQSETSFLSDEKETALYIFVAEEIDTQRIVGTASIARASPYTDPKYYYRLETVEIRCPLRTTPRTLSLLRPFCNTTPSTEIGGLFIQKAHRHSGQGKLLSLSRFLFMAAFPDRIIDPIFAELRGIIDSNGNSPFWNHVGRHFCDVSLEEALEARIENRDFVAAILPMYPLYVSLLSPEAQHAIGETFLHTKPALTMLLQEGFTRTGEIDAFDGGPRLEAPRKKIASLQQAVKATVADITPLPDTETPYLLSNASLAFRACLSPLEQIAREQILIPPKTAHTMLLRKGDAVWYLPREETNHQL